LDFLLEASAFCSPSAEADWREFPSILREGVAGKGQKNRKFLNWREKEKEEKD